MRADRLLKIQRLDRITLKNRILLLFVAATFIPFIYTSYLSYNTITSILTTKIQTGIQSNLKQVRLSFENTLDNLNHVSQQLSLQGSVGKQLELYLAAREPFERSRLTNEIKSQLNLITFTNPNIGLTLYYFKDDETILFESMGVKDSFDIDALPVIAEYYGITYYGPHISNDRFNNQYVLSALRKVELQERDEVYVYIESGFQLTQSILELDDVGKHTNHIVLDNNGRIAYSELNDVFPMNTIFLNNKHLSDNKGVTGGYYWYRQVSNQGWSIISLISQSNYNREKNQWLIQMAVAALIFIAVSVTIGWLLWKMVYRPLSRFHKEMKWFANSNFNTVSVSSKIPEFEALLTQFQHMKVQIAHLYSEVERKEKRRADLEIEKLLHQINPHFLMNTLDTAHWLAVINGQDEIDRLVTSLNKLLYYNLKKGNRMSTIREEIDSLKQYLILQQIRYNFQFDVRIQVPDELLDIPVPPFMLQPLVENALYHGLDDKGRIEVEVGIDQGLRIDIRDNGGGISQEAIEQLLSQEVTKRDKVGMGIGMNYVKRMLESHYEGRASLSVSSRLGEGTHIQINIPIDRMGEADSR